MDWQKMPVSKKLAYLSGQMEEIKRAKALLERFERFTQRRIARIEAWQKKQASDQKTEQA